MEPREWGKHVLGGTMGIGVADALGVPVEFIAREALERDPVVGTAGTGLIFFVSH